MGCPNCGAAEGYEINSMSDFVCAHCGALVCMNPLAKGTRHNPKGGYYVKLLDARQRYPEFAKHNVDYWRIDTVLAIGNQGATDGI